MRKEERKARLKALKQARKQAKRDAREAAAAPQAALSPEVMAQIAADAETPAPAVAEAVADAVAEARTTLRADTLEESELVAMLGRAARLLDDVIVLARGALAKVPLPRLQEALEIIRAEKAAPPTEGDAQKRPRRGSDPVITLLKLSIQASSLQQRVLNRLRPLVSSRAA